MNTCIYCGSEKNLTTDHIPSKGLFPDLYPKENMITVPSCKMCNQGYSKDEEFFRNFVCSMSLERSKHADELFFSKIKRSMIRSPAIRQAALNKMDLVEIFAENGRSLGERTGLKVPDEDWDRHHRILSKYIRGLLFKELDGILPSEYQIKHFLGNDALLKLIKQMRKWNLDNKDIFAYGFGYLPGSYKSIWTTVYFNYVFFISIVAPQGYIENLLENRKKSQVH